jgi:SAM-dependent methyltransferase
MASVGEVGAGAPLTDGKTEAIARIIRGRIGRPIRNLLVVGCGSGVEAAILARELGADVIGIDLNSTFDPRASVEARLLRGDATRLEFSDESFDFVFSYHALEHIPDYRRALAEMNRVLRPRGGYCIGTPNRRRLIGYLGSKEATLRQKIWWNLIDIWAMLRGKFRNEFGAHAGFLSSELGEELKHAFGTADEITLDYYLAIYHRHTKLIRFIDRSRLGTFLLPSVYFMGQK